MLTNTQVGALRVLDALGLAYEIKGEHAVMKDFVIIEADETQCVNKAYKEQQKINKQQSEVNVIHFILQNKIA